MSAAYLDRLVDLRHGDNAAELADVRGADLAIVDPPYGDTSLPWDQRTTAWLPVVDRCLAPVAGLWLWGSLASLLDMLPAAFAAGWTRSHDIVWEKHNGSGSTADRFRRVHEQAAFLYRGPWAQVHHDMQYSADAQARTVRRKQRPTHWGQIGEHAYVSEDGGPRQMRSVMYERSAHGTAIHPTQKPLGITRSLIQYGCPPGGLVIDPYAGSATTLLAARQAGRRAIGAEAHRPYVEASIERLSELTLDLSGATT